MSNFLWLHGLQHARPPCPSQIPGVYSNSCPLSQWCHPTITPSLIPFSSYLQSLEAYESALRIRRPKYWSFSFTISPSNEHPGLICFRMNWLDLLAVQGSLRSLLQHHSSKDSVLLLIGQLFCVGHGVKQLCILTSFYLNLTIAPVR